MLPDLWEAGVFENLLVIWPDSCSCSKCLLQRAEVIAEQIVY